MLTVDFKKLGIRAGYRILDIGCGSGPPIVIKMYLPLVPTWMQQSFERLKNGYDFMTDAVKTAAAAGA